MLSHEKLKVYDFTIEFYALTSLVVDSLPRGHGSVKDQLKRAATSIPLNIAEGAGKITPRDQSKYYAIARGSALECGAIYDLMKVLKVIGPKRYKRGKRLLVQIASMLSNMIK
ncbi:MAG: four helix bundle protein [Persicimonas sp.]